jgi:CHAD domain-containing protein
VQVLLEEIVPGRDRKEKKLLKVLNRIRRRAGQVRDVDVQLAALRTLKVPLEPRRKTQLMQQLIELRVAHEKRLRKLLKKQDISEIQRRLRKASKEAYSEAGFDPLQVARGMLNSVKVSDGLNDDVLHRYRIAVKRARYAAEFASKSPEAAQLIIALKRLQDALGQWHDWLTLTQTATRHLGEVNQSPLVAALHNLTRGKFRHAVSALAESPGLPPTEKKTPRSRVLAASNLERPTSAERTETAA